MDQHSNPTAVAVFDTTLRDGMQGMEISFTLDDKIQIAHALDDFGIDYIEGGFPLANEKEAEFFRLCKHERFKHAKIAAFGSTRRPGGDAQRDAHTRALLDADTPVVVVVGKAWTEHVRHVLQTDLEENLRMVGDTVAFLKREQREVVFDLEHFFDGYRADGDYARRVLDTAVEAGADWCVLCDTNGGTLPHEVQRIFADLTAAGFAKLGGHFHNDCGTAVANSVAAVVGGATHIQGTINGWGERCGNANLCVFVPNLLLKLQRPAFCADRMSHLTSLSRFVAEKANIIPDKRQPYVGIAAFSHKAGQHADVIAKAPQLMEHTDAALVGNSRQILLSELAGKSTIVDKLAKYGLYDKNSPVVAALIKELKDREALGYEYEAAEASFDLLVRKTLGLYRPLLELKNYHLESFKTADSTSKTVGRLFLNSEGKEMMGAAVGVGPVETLDAALRDALTPHHRYLAKVALIDYRVRVLNPERASAAKVRVFITSSDHEQTWETVGVHENIVEASWQALVDSLEYYYNLTEPAETA